MSHRVALPLLLLTLSLASRASLAEAQEPTDSILARLERAERLIEVLQVQVAEQAEARIEPRSRNQLELSGLVLLNGFYTSAKVNNTDVPLWAELPDAGATQPEQALGGTFRQSRIGLTAFVPDLLGGEFMGEIQASFFGGHLDNGRLLPLLAIRRIRAELRWSNVWVMVGQEQPPFTEVDPSSLAQLEYPGFSASGNLWYWMPQVRVGAGTNGDVRFGIEAAALAPMDGPAQPTGVATTPNNAERSGRPFMDGRVLVEWGDPGYNGGTVSVGGHYGWTVSDAGSMLVSKAIGASAQFFVTEYAEVRAEAFTGQALGTLGGGGAGTSYSAVGIPLRTKGGWAQLNLLPNLEWEIGAGYGFDDPNDADFPALTSYRLKNAAWEVHAMWRPRPLVLGMEYRHFTTTYGDGTGAYGGAYATTAKAGHFNLAMGFEF